MNSDVKRGMRILRLLPANRSKNDFHSRISDSFSQLLYSLKQWTGYGANEFRTRVKVGNLCATGKLLERYT